MELLTCPLKPLSLTSQSTRASSTEITDYEHGVTDQVGCQDYEVHRRTHNESFKEQLWPVGTEGGRSFDSGRRFVGSEGG